MPNNILAQFLYTTEKEGEEVCDLKPGKQISFKEYLQSSLPKFCLKCKFIRPNKRDEQFKRARKQLKHELDLVSLIQQLRFFHSAITEIIPSHKIKVLKD